MARKNSQSLSQNKNIHSFPGQYLKYNSSYVSYLTIIYWHVKIRTAFRTTITYPQYKERVKQNNFYVHYLNIVYCVVPQFFWQNIYIPTLPRKLLNMLFLTYMFWNITLGPINSQFFSHKNIIIIQGKNKIIYFLGILTDNNILAHTIAQCSRTTTHTNITGTKVKQMNS